MSSGRYRQRSRSRSRDRDRRRDRSRSRSRSRSRHRDRSRSRERIHSYEDDQFQRRERKRSRSRSLERDDTRRNHFGTHEREYNNSYRPRNEDNKRNKIEEPPPLYSIHRGKVASIQEYGVFVQYGEFAKQGLVHISQISKHKVAGKEEIESMLTPGDQVWVKVIGISDEGKVGLSLKYVDQADGTDNDVNEVDLLTSGQKRREHTYEKKAIELGAVLDTLCTRCKGKGHLAAECYATDTNAKYDLIESPTREEIEMMRKPIERHDKKEKKEKKHKKHKKSKKDKKDKKEKKHHHHHHHH